MKERLPGSAVLRGDVRPGSVIGVLGGGQLGRMFAVAAKQLGYRVRVYCPEEDPPAGQIGDSVTRGSYDDAEALRRFAATVDVVTLEFENIPVAATNIVGEIVPVRPQGSVLYTTQHRVREKRFLRDAGFPVTPFRDVSSPDELALAASELGGNVILKTAESGYDGKGQVALGPEDDPAHAWRAVAPGGSAVCVVEQRIDLLHEASCLVARAIDGEMCSVGVFGNTHVDHILDTTLYPAPLAESQREKIAELSRSIAKALDVVGVMCVEYFIDGRGEIMVNEIAPRPHNSGHVTIEAVVCSQFEQQARAICGLPLGSNRMVSPGAMVNLLGDVWESGEPDWDALRRFPEVHLHLYGKQSPRRGRKMGHLTVLAPTAEEAAEYAAAARRALRRGGP